MSTTTAAPSGEKQPHKELVHEVGRTKIIAERLQAALSRDEGAHGAEADKLQRVNGQLLAILRGIGGDASGL